METYKVNRRAFVGTVGLAAVGALLPSFSPLQTPAPYAKTGPLTDWSIDDMTGAAPRYAEPIAHPRFRSFEIADANPLDTIFAV